MGETSATVLLIEDDELSANLIRRVMERAGHTVIHTNKGYEGLDIAIREDVDLILLDLGLPDVDGQTVAGLLARMPHQIPVVAVTGRTGEAARERAKAFGVNDYITKPINTRTFVDDLAVYLMKDEGSL